MSSTGSGVAGISFQTTTLSSEAAAAYATPAQSLLQALARRTAGLARFHLDSSRASCSGVGSGHFARASSSSRGSRSSGRGFWSSVILRFLDHQIRKLLTQSASCDMQRGVDVLFARLQQPGGLGDGQFFVDGQHDHLPLSRREPRNVLGDALPLVRRPGETSQIRLERSAPSPETSDVPAASFGWSRNTLMMIWNNHVRNRESPRNVRYFRATRSSVSCTMSSAVSVRPVRRIANRNAAGRCSRTSRSRSSASIGAWFIELWGPVCSAMSETTDQVESQKSIGRFWKNFQKSPARLQSSQPGKHTQSRSVTGPRCIRALQRADTVPRSARAGLAKVVADCSPA